MQALMKLAEVERQHLIDALIACRGNRTHAARMLGISVRTVRNKLALYRRDGFREEDALIMAAAPGGAGKALSR